MALKNAFEKNNACFGFIETGVDVECPKILLMRANSGK